MAVEPQLSVLPQATDLLNLNWMQMTNPVLAPASVLLFGGIGNMTAPHTYAAPHMRGYISAHLGQGISFSRMHTGSVFPDMCVAAEFDRNRCFITLYEYSVA
jgi:hypothetical protein